MDKSKLTPQDLQDFGLPELAYQMEQEGGGTPDLGGESTEAKTEAGVKIDLSDYSPVPKETSEKDNPQQKTFEELRSLLGPLVGPLLRDAQGKLDLSKVKATSFAEFRKFLQTQVEIDGKSFNQYDVKLAGKKIGLSAYHKILGKKKYEPLLKLLYEGVPHPNPLPKGEGTAFLFPSPPLGGEGQGEGVAPSQHLLSEFTAEVVDVSADMFVGHHLGTKEGRSRIRGILGDSGYFNQDIKADVLKAIASVGKSQGLADLDFHQFEKSISTWNYFNVEVTDEEIDRASHFAERILDEADWQEEHVAKLQEKYEKHPDRVRSIPSNVKELNSPITGDCIKAKYELYTENKDKGDPVSQMKAKLAHFWLMSADSDHWLHENHLHTYERRAFLINNIESLLEDLDQVTSAQDFQAFNGKLQGFLDAPLPLKEKGSWLDETLNWARHETVGHGLAELLEAIPDKLKSPYLELSQFSDELHYAYEMGETVPIEIETQATEEKTKLAATHFIQGLQQAKRSLWYNYKQHKLLSRAGSNVASIVGAGDISDIERANEQIDSWISTLQQSTSQEQIKDTVNELYASLKAEGLLHQALDSAQMDGLEQMIGLGQTVLIILATTALTGGAGTSGVIARAGAALGNTLRTANTVKNLGTVAARTAQVTTLGQRASYGLKMGAWISFAENQVAIHSGEVRQEKDTLLKLAKDSFATSLAMGFFTPLAARAGSVLEQNVLKRLLTRYFTNPVQGAGRFLGDTGLEGLEEVFDATLRHKLDGKVGAITWDELREITTVSTAGGGAKVGSIANQFRSNPSLRGSPEASRGNLEGPAPSVDSGQGPASDGMAAPAYGGLAMTKWGAATAGAMAGMAVLLNPETSHASVQLGEQATTQGPSGILTGLLTVAGMGLLGMAIQGKKGKKGGEEEISSRVRARREGSGEAENFYTKISQALSHFLVPLSPSDWEQVQKDMKILDSHPGLSKTHFRREIEYLYSQMEAGSDPLIVLHNTGADPKDLTSLFNGKGEGSFPLVLENYLSLRRNHYSNQIRKWAAGRKSPNLSVDLKIPASKLLHWLVENSEAVLPNSGSFERVQATKMASLIKLAHETGAATILRLPTGKFPLRSWDELYKSMVEAGLPESVLVPARGPFFETVNLDDEWAVQRASLAWASKLERPAVEAEEKLIQAWVGLLLEHNSHINSDNWHEYPLWREISQLASRFRMPVPPDRIQKIIQNNFLEALQEKQGSPLSLPEGLSPEVKKAMERSPLNPTVHFALQELGKGESNLPKYFVFRALAGQFEVPLDILLGRMNRSSRGNREQVHEALGFLEEEFKYFNSTGEKTEYQKIQYEIDWILAHRVKAAIPRLRSHLLSADMRIRKMALQAVIDLEGARLPTEFSELTLLLSPYLKQDPNLSQEELEEVEMIFKALSIHGLPVKHYRERLATSRRNLQSHPHWRVRAAAEISFLRLDGNETLPTAGAYLKSNRPEERLYALKVLDAFPKKISAHPQYENILEMVFENLSHENVEISNAAARVLGGIKDSKVSERMIEAFHIEDRLEVKIELVRNLGRQGRPEARSDLDYSLGKADLPPQLRLEIIRTLGKIGKKDSIPSLKNYLEGHGEAISLAVAHSLLALGEVDAVYPIYRDFLVHPDAGIRGEAIQSLLDHLKSGKRKPKRLVEKLGETAQIHFESFLYDPEPKIRWATEELLDQVQNGWDRKMAESWKVLQEKIQELDPKVIENIHEDSYQEFLKASLAEAERGMTELSTQHRNKYPKILQQAVRGELSPEETLVRLIDVLEQDFREFLKGTGTFGTYNLKDAYVASQQMDPSFKIPEEIRRWLSQMPEDKLIVPELVIPIDIWGKINDEGSEVYQKLEFLLTIYEGMRMYGVLPNRFALSLASDDVLELTDKQAIRVPFLPPELLFQLARLSFPHSAVQVVPTVTLSTRMEMRGMYHRHQRPLIVSPRSWEIENMPKMTSYLATLHDIFHQVAINNLSRQFREDMGIILEIFKEMGLSLEEKGMANKPVENILDGLFPNEERGWKIVFDEWGDRLQRDKHIFNFYSRLRKKLKGHPRGPKILAAFEVKFKEPVSRFRDYAEFLRLARSEILRRDQALMEDHLNDFLDILDQAEKKSWPPLKTAASLMEILEKDFIELLKSYGAKDQDGSYNFEDTLAKQSKETRAVGEKIIKWAKRHRVKLDKLPQLTLDAKVYDRIEKDPEVGVSLRFYSTGSKILADLMGLEKEFFFRPMGIGKYRIRFLPPGLLIHLSHILKPDSAIELRPTAKLSSPEEVSRLLESFERPFILSTRNQDLHGAKKIQPYVNSFHDIFHAFRMSLLPRDMQTALNPITAAFNDFGEFYDKAEILENIQDGQVNPNDPDFSEFFPELGRNLESIQERIEMGRALAKRLQGHPLGDEILAAYQAELLPPEKVLAAFYGLENQLMDWLKGNEIEVSSENTKKLLESLKKNGMQFPPWLLGALQGSELGRTLVLNFSVEESKFKKWEHGKPYLWGNLKLMEDVSVQINELSGLPEGFLFYQKDGVRHYRILPPEILVDLHQRIYGTQAVEAHLSTSTSTFQEIRQMFAKRGRPLILPERPQNIEGYSQVQPWVAAYHDIYHLLTLSRISPELTEASQEILEIMDEMEIILPVQLREMILDGLQIVREEDFLELFDGLSELELSDPGLAKEFRSKLYSRLSNHPLSDVVLDAFDKVFSDTSKEAAGGSSLHSLAFVPLMGVAGTAPVDGSNLGLWASLLLMGGVAMALIQDKTKFVEGMRRFFNHRGWLPSIIRNQSNLLEVSQEKRESLNRLQELRDLRNQALDSELALNERRFFFNLYLKKLEKLPESKELEEEALLLFPLLDEPSTLFWDVLEAFQILKDKLPAEHPVIENALGELEAKRGQWSEFPDQIEFLDAVIAKLNAPKDTTSDYTEPSESVLKLNEKILQGDLGAIRRAGVYYIFQDASTAFTEEGSIIVRGYFDPRDGALVAIGNPQNLPSGITERYHLVRFKVRVNPKAGTEARNSEFTPYIEKVQANPNLKLRIRAALTRMKGKPFKQAGVEIDPDDEVTPVSHHAGMVPALGIVSLGGQDLSPLGLGAAMLGGLAMVVHSKELLSHMKGLTQKVARRIRSVVRGLVEISPEELQELGLSPETEVESLGSQNLFLARSPKGQGNPKLNFDTHADGTGSHVNFDLLEKGPEGKFHILEPHEILDKGSWTEKAPKELEIIFPDTIRPVSKPQKKKHWVFRNHFAQGYLQILKVYAQGKVLRIPVFVEAESAEEYAPRLKKVLRALQGIPFDILREIRKEGLETIEVLARTGDRYGFSKQEMAHYSYLHRALRIFSVDEMPPVEMMDTLRHELGAHALIRARYTAEEQEELKTRVLMAIKAGGKNAEAFYSRFIPENSIYERSWEERLAEAVKIYLLMGEEFWEADPFMAPIVEELVGTKTPPSGIHEKPAEISEARTKVSGMGSFGPVVGAGAGLATFFGSDLAKAAQDSKEIAFYQDPLFWTMMGPALFLGLATIFFLPLAINRLTRHLRQKFIARDRQYTLSDEEYKILNGLGWKVRIPKTIQGEDWIKIQDYYCEKVRGRKTNTGIRDLSDHEILFHKIDGYFLKIPNGTTEVEDQSNENNEFNPEDETGWARPIHPPVALEDSLPITETLPAMEPFSLGTQGKKVLEESLGRKFPDSLSHHEWKALEPEIVAKTPHVEDLGRLIEYSDPLTTLYRKGLEHFYREEERIKRTGKKRGPSDSVGALSPLVGAGFGLDALMMSGEAHAWDPKQENSQGDYTLAAFISFLILAGVSAAWVYRKRKGLIMPPEEITPPAYRDRISSVEEGVRKNIGYGDQDPLQVTIRESDPGEEVRFLPLMNASESEMDEAWFSRVYDKTELSNTDPMELSSLEGKVLGKALDSPVPQKIGFETWVLWENKIPQVCYARFSNLTEEDRQILLKLHVRGLRHFYGEPH